MSNREETTNELIEYTNQMQGGQKICREIIVARFMLTKYTPRNLIKEILWALDRQNIVHITEKISCPQCQNRADPYEQDFHRLIIKIDENHPRPPPQDTGRIDVGRISSGIPKNEQ